MRISELETPSGAHPLKMLFMDGQQLDLKHFDELSQKMDGVSIGKLGTDKPQVFFPGFLKKAQRNTLFLSAFITKNLTPDHAMI